MAWDGMVVLGLVSNVCFVVVVECGRGRGVPCSAPDPSAGRPRCPPPGSPLVAPLHPSEEDYPKTARGV
ncbi:hypothetical protein T265_01830 [Opisthorchis viverrini]|uniref:Uncharacterized protein n=1 Tax=Opisthorchis viverrini TaxID=6198 RepID=A0A074ZX60_OPIVI|nr:hypothetical protein T265_01830 [Opisthorchis viverrini]KER32053.1 hypothetical protein T265_01830 [Opisthorchis viverrini]